MKTKMKTKLLFFALLLVAFTACEMDSESNYSPNIQFTKFPVVINKSDTLLIKTTDTSNLLKLDTITVGDTVSFGMYFTGYINNLVSFSISQSADSVSRIILPSKLTLDSIFLSSSNYAQGNFLLKSKVVSIYFPFKYVAIKTSNEAKITFSVTSDANFESNSYKFELKTPIIENKTIGLQ